MSKSLPEGSWLLSRLLLPGNEDPSKSYKKNENRFTQILHRNCIFLTKPNPRRFCTENRGYFKTEQKPNFRKPFCTPLVFAWYSLSLSVSWRFVYVCACVAIQLIAIGPVTAAEMTRSLARLDGTASRPDPQHVCHVIECLNVSHWYSSHWHTVYKSASKICFFLQDILVTLFYLKILVNIVLCIVDFTVYC